MPRKLVGFLSRNCVIKCMLDMEKAGNGPLDRS